ncbi:uncharacterized protein LOC127278676 [Leptopilina boulardi]|uniref:uncharacterized protein LOC127278676 n=1 Tax=Leptopilina boulardi TaxID=63433 RepID=UPI0021F5C11D|nr:uncharacterized protein LOC127278676 [Leptopilina boulardi]XP_051156451.1 uncharacterized protein LOC127278676 [Leptopilina boulardi]
MDISNFLNSVQIIYIATFYIGSVLTSENIPSPNNEIFKYTVFNEKELSRVREITRLKNLEIDEPELFYNLTHPNNFPKNCTNLNEKMRNLYNSTFNTRNRRSDFNFIFRRTSDFYNKGNLSSFVRFEDYFALKYYSIKGYDEILKKSDISKRMKNALYSVAITQSSNPNEKFHSILFKGNSERKSQYRKRFNQTGTKFKLSIFNKVNLIQKKAEIEAELTKKESNNKFNDMVECVFEIYFSKPYLRVNLDDYNYWNNIEDNRYETVLLPKTEFVVNETIWNNVNTTNERLTIKIIHNDENMELFDQQKKVMSELKELRKSKTKFYVC